MKKPTPLETAKAILAKFNTNPKEWCAESYIETRAVCEAFLQQDALLLEAREIIYAVKQTTKYRPSCSKCREVSHICEDYMELRAQGFVPQHLIAKIEGERGC